MLQQDIDLLKKYAIPWDKSWLIKQKLKNLKFMDEKLTKVPEVSLKLREIIMYIVDVCLKGQISDCEEKRDKIFENSYQIEDSFLTSITKLNKQRPLRISTYIG